MDKRLGTIQLDKMYCLYITEHGRNLRLPDSLILSGALSLILRLTLLLVLRGALRGIHGLIRGLAHVLRAVVALRGCISTPFSCTERTTAA